MKLTIDPEAGMAGDMFVAALVDSGAPWDEVSPVIACAGGLLGRAEARLERPGTAADQGVRLRTAYVHDRSGTNAALIETMLERVSREFSFSARESGFAGRAFNILCEAEAAAHRTIDGQAGHHHGAGKEHIHLHEAQDILVDICGAARALTLLDVDLTGVVCLSPVFMGGGTVTFSHGTHDVPAPAVREIINHHGLPVAAGPVPRELLTPTGASLLAALAPRFVERAGFDVPPGAATGFGLGTIDFGTVNGVRNGLRVFIHG